MNRIRLLSLILCLFLAGCASLAVDIQPADIATKAAGAQTSVARAITDTAPLRATSQHLVKTVVAGSETQAPPVLTAVAQTVYRISAGLDSTGFRWPLVVAVPRPGCMYASLECRDKFPLTGMELTTGPDNKKLSRDVLAAGPGTVARIQASKAGCAAEGGDCGMGNTVILQHVLQDGSRIYSLYAHLDSLNPDLLPGACVPAGTKLGVMGASASGERKHFSKPFLHFEFKTLPVLGDPYSAKNNAKKYPDGRYFGYLGKKESVPEKWGYVDPAKIIAEGVVMNCR